MSISNYIPLYEKIILTEKSIRKVYPKCLYLIEKSIRNVLREKVYI